LFDLTHPSRIYRCTVLCISASIRTAPNCALIDLTCIVYILYVRRIRTQVRSWRKELIDLLIDFLLESSLAVSGCSGEHEYLVGYSLSRVIRSLRGVRTTNTTAC